MWIWPLPPPRLPFQIYSQYSVEQRIALMEKLLEIYMGRYDEMAAAISAEMGAPISFATEAHADCGRGPYIRGARGT